MNLRTDLALERREMIKDTVPDGVEFEESFDGNVKTTKIRITDISGEKAIGKPRGLYITIELEYIHSDFDEESPALKALSSSLDSLLPDEGLVLVAGLGNENITPDALGPLTAGRILATRHLKLRSEKYGLPILRQTAVLFSGVLGQTGMESAEIIKAVCEKINPVAVIVIDALATAGVDRLGKTIQLSDTGICPGSGVGNSRERIDKDCLGVPVISVGVPTVIDLNSLTDAQQENGSSEKNGQMMVTPRNIDEIIRDMSFLLSSAINLSLQKSLSLQDVLSLV